MVVCVSGSRGEENALAKSACLDRLPHGRLSHGCTASTQQMSSLYARATAARPKPSRPATGVLVVYISTRKIVPPEASDRPARCASVRRHGLGRAVTFSLGGSSAAINIIKVIPVDRLGL
jgi:hypothetical protein